MSIHFPNEIPKPGRSLYLQPDPEYQKGSFQLSNQKERSKDLNVAVPNRSSDFLWWGATDDAGVGIRRRRRRPPSLVSDGLYSLLLEFC